MSYSIPIPALHIVFRSIIAVYGYIVGASLNELHSNMVKSDLVLIHNTYFVCPLGLQLHAAYKLYTCSIF